LGSATRTTRCVDKPLLLPSTPPHTRLSSGGQILSAAFCSFVVIVIGVGCVVILVLVAFLTAKKSSPLSPVKSGSNSSDAIVTSKFDSRQGKKPRPAPDPHTLLFIGDCRPFPLGRSAGA
jgi:hypothetical protein